LLLLIKALMRSSHIDKKNCSYEIESLGAGLMAFQSS